MNSNAKRVMTLWRTITQVKKPVCPLIPKSSHAPTEVSLSEKVSGPSKIRDLSGERLAQHAI